MSPWPLPTLIVEVAFANNMSTPIASCTWTNVTADVVTASTNTGKSDPTSTQAEAGRATIRLFNVSGRYNPFNTASPYYGPFTDGADTAVLGLVPMKRIRVRATWAGTTYNVWSGFVESWQMVWPSPAEAYCDVTATDGFKQLNLRVLGTATRRRSGLTAPGSGPWLGDPTGSTTVTASIPEPSTGSPSYIGTVGPGVALGQTASLALDTTTCAVFDGSANAVISFGQTPQVGGVSTSCAAEMWVSTPDTTATVRSIAQHGYYNGPRWQVTYQGSTHTLTLNVTDTTGTDTVTATVTINDNLPHHLAFTMDAGGFLDTIFVDGSPLNSVVASHLPGSLGPLLIGSDISALTSNWHGAIQDFAIYPGILSNTQIANHHTVGVSALAGQLSGARIASLLTFAGSRAADRTGRRPVHLQGTSLGQGALTEIQTVTATEGPALFFQAGDGTATFYDRNHILTGTALTSQVTIGETGEPYELAGTTVDMDDLQVWNITPVARANGVTVQASDPVSVARYGPRTLTGGTALQMQTDAAAADLANYLLVRYANPVIQPHAIQINPHDDPTNLFPQVLGRQLLDRVTVTRTAPGGGTAWSQQANIIAVAHAIDPTAGWQTTWTLSPYEAVPFLILDNATYGLLDTDRLYF